MFDSVLDRGAGPKGRFGTGAIVSVILHIGLLGLALWISTRPQEEPEEKLPTEVTLRMGTMAPPPPPPPPPPAATHKTVTPKKPKKDVIIPPKEIPQTKPPETEQKEEPEAAPEEASEQEVEGGVEGGVAGGVVGGVVGGVIGGVVGGQLGSTGTDVLPFGEGMSRPEPIVKPNPQYTREALEARVQGLMIVKCVITVEGKVERCRTIKPLPHMEQAVLDALYAARYKPVTFQGRPVAVDFVFNLRLQLPSGR